jgi:hypothetical protein
MAHFDEQGIVGILSELEDSRTTLHRPLGRGVTPAFSSPTFQFLFCLFTAKVGPHLLTKNLLLFDFFFITMSFYSTFAV